MLRAQPFAPRNQGRDAGSAQSSGTAKLDALVKYYRTLLLLDRRFDCNALKCRFSWRDAFQPAIFDSPRSTSL